jgi:GTP cyclohydrolase I
VNDVHGKDTPRRFVQMLKELTTPEPIKWTVFPSEGIDEMITVRDIPFTSVCEHHVIPFLGMAHIGYIPDQLLPGLSKTARVVQHFAKRLQVQERLTRQVADFLDYQLRPHGVIVVMDAEHLCMTVRGVQVPGAKTRTTAVKGRFADHERTAKAEFMSGLNGGR